MTDHFFQATNPIWYLLCDGGLLQLGILTFCPYIMPYESLSLYGQFTKYLAYNQHYLLLTTFWIAIFLHVFESIIALRVCKKLNMDSNTTQKWFTQTFLLGYVSLGILRNYAAKQDAKRNR